MSLASVLEDERATIRESVERDQRQLRRAFADLKAAVREPLGIVARIEAHPLPWFLGAVLFGLWLGSRSDNGGYDER